jgi:ADP-ribosylglycohydrolase
MTQVRLDADRVTGSVIGAAVGDALGHPVEFISSLEAIRQKFGPNGITGYTLFWKRSGRQFASYTDDTQMEVVLRSLLDSRALSEGLEPAMRRMGRGFTEWGRSPQGGHRAPQANPSMIGTRDRGFRLGFRASRSFQRFDFTWVQRSRGCPGYLGLYGLFSIS